MRRGGGLAVLGVLLAGLAGGAVARDGQGGGALRQAPAPQSVAPACLQPSHDRLIIRKGRDVCAGTLGSQGRPVASGYLPTVCGDGSRTYRVDAKGLADRCVRPAGNQGEN